MYVLNTWPILPGITLTIHQPLALMLRSLHIFAIILLLTLSSCDSAPPSSPQENIVYTSGEGEYHTYRIPAIIATQEGTLLAFAEGRKGGQGDAGNIDLLVKRSTDNGLTWSAPIVVWDDSTNTCGNPAPVVDRETGAIHLLMTWNKGTDDEGEIMTGTSEYPRKVFHTTSTDDGRTWATPKDISDSTRKPDWRWYATGPVNGIQLESGRLIIPANHSIPAETRDPATYRSHIIYSDDGGATWNLGGTHEDYTNESTIAILSDGRLMQNMRSYHGQNRRAISTSDDGGQTWSPVRLDTALVEPVCQASLLRHRHPDAEYPQGILLFSNPANTSRNRMTIRASFDDGVTWPAKYLVYEGSAAYSSLVTLPDQRIGLLYERNDYSEIVFWQSGPFWE